MGNFDNDTLLKIMAGFAVVFAGILGFFAQLIVKKIDNNFVQRKEKENQKLKFYIPLLRCLYELDDRFIRIFQNLDKDWLSAKYLEDIKQKKGFAENPKEKGYFIISSIYLIGCFFGVTEAIKKGVDTTRLSFNRKRTIRLPKWMSKKFRVIFKSRIHYDIFQFDPDITIICRLLQNKELFNHYISSKNYTKPKDANEIHKHFQHSIGEMMLEKVGDDKYRVKTFREFYELYINDDSFRFWFILIEGYFTDLCNFDASKKFEKKAELKNDIRPLRLLAIQYWCRKLMSNIAKELELDELNFETRKPDEVLKSAEVDNDLNKLISSYKLENSDTYLLGLKINND
jgi:hypothetical protein